MTRQAIKSCMAQSLAQYSSRHSNAVRQVVQNATVPIALCYARDHVECVKLLFHSEWVVEDRCDMFNTIQIGRDTYGSLVQIFDYQLLSYYVRVFHNNMAKWFRDPIMCVKRLYHQSPDCHILDNGDLYDPRVDQVDLPLYRRYCSRMHYLMKQSVALHRLMLVRWITDPSFDHSERRHIQFTNNLCIDLAHDNPMHFFIHDSDKWCLRSMIKNRLVPLDNALFRYVDISRSLALAEHVYTGRVTNVLVTQQSRPWRSSSHLSGYVSAEQYSRISRLTIQPRHCTCECCESTICDSDGPNVDDVVDNLSVILKMLNLVSIRRPTMISQYSSIPRQYYQSVSTCCRALILVESSCHLVIHMDVIVPRHLVIKQYFATRASICSKTSSQQMP